MDVFNQDGLLPLNSHCVLKDFERFIIVLCYKLEFYALKFNIIFSGGLLCQSMEYCALQWDFVLCSAYFAL